MTNQPPSPLLDLIAEMNELIEKTYSGQQELGLALLWLRPLLKERLNRLEAALSQPKGKAMFGCPACLNGECATHLGTNVR